MLMPCLSQAQPNAFLPRPPPEHVAIVTNCLGVHADASETVCIGVVSKECTANATTFDAKDKCVLYESFVWNELIMQDRLDLLARLPDDLQKKVLESEEVSTKASQARCALLQSLVPQDAAQAKFEARKCHLQAVALRVLWLRSLERVAGTKR